MVVCPIPGGRSYRGGANRREIFAKDQNKMVDKSAGSGDCYRCIAVDDAVSIKKVRRCPSIKMTKNVRTIDVYVIFSLRL